MRPTEKLANQEITETFLANSWPVGKIWFDLSLAICQWPQLAENKIK